MLSLLSAFGQQFCRAFNQETRRLNQYGDPWTSCIGAIHSLFDLTLQTSRNILELLEFTYAHAARQESSEIELRALVVHYAACKTEILKRDVDLRSLLEANGEIGV